MLVTPGLEAKVPPLVIEVGLWLAIPETDLRRCQRCVRGRSFPGPDRAPAVFRDEHSVRVQERRWHADDFGWRCAHGGRNVSLMHGGLDDNRLIPLTLWSDRQNRRRELGDGGLAVLGPRRLEGWFGGE